MVDLDGCITDVPGVMLGHAQREDGRTGCSVVVVDHGATAGAAIAGSAPGTRETELLHPNNKIMAIHAVLLTGGSTFGLAAATGVQRWLSERNVGFEAESGVVVPIVPSACIFDLDVGEPYIYPDPDLGYAAASAADDATSAQGRVGAGLGALCGKALGSRHAMRGGLGTASGRLANGVVVGAVVVCNAWGDAVGADGQLLAGARRTDGSFLESEDWLHQQTQLSTRYFGMNTTLCCVATNAKLSPAETGKVAAMAQAGIARATRPANTLFDGDVIFALSTGEGIEVDVNVVGSLGARLVSHALRRGVRAANA